MFIKVHVTAGAKEEKIDRLANDLFEITVKEKAERNLANDRVIAILRGYFGDAGEIRLVSGHHSPHKIVSVDIGE